MSHAFGEETPPNGARGGPAVVAGITFLGFLPSLAAGFVYDDLLLIAENPYAQGLRHLARGFRTHLWDVYAFGSNGIGLRYYRPLVTASYIVNWWASGGAPWAFHLVNVICHAMATFLAVRIATRWTCSSALGILAGLLFGLHPSRTESVIWVSGRTDVLMALFTLLTVELAHEAGRRRGVALGVAAVLSTCASILSKEAGALTALFVGVDFLLANAGGRERRRLGPILVLAGVLGAAYLGLRSAMYPVGRGASLDPTFRYGLFTVWAYVERIVFPWPQTFFYRPVEARGGIPHYPPTVLALGVLASAGYVALLVRAWKRDRPAFAILFIALALIGPLLNFSYTGIYVTTSDHFLYLPLFVFSVGVLRLYRGTVFRLQDVRASRILFAGALAIYVGIDCVRVLDYRSDETFWEHEVDLNPYNPVALQNLSGILSRFGDVQAAYGLMQRVVAPSATRFFLLAGDDGARAASRARLLGLEAALLADGDIVRLERLFGELDGLFSVIRSLEEQGARKLHSGGEVLPRQKEGELPRSGSLNTVAADTALVGTRIGRMARSRELANAVSDEMIWHMASPPNFVLTLARVGDLPRAQSILEQARHPPPGILSMATKEVLDSLHGRLQRAEGLMRSAGNGRAETARVDLALAFSELGAYVQALRVLRPEFDREPHAEEIDPIYVQLLVSARLEREALSTATALLGPERGRAAVERYAQQLPPRLRALPLPPEPSPWWHP